MDKIIVLIGAPGAGKGTQARLLEERRGIKQISTGDLFRAMKKAQTPLALEVQDVMASGKLVSDELTYEVVRERATRDDITGTYVLDGYPRTAVQAGQLENLAEEQGREILAIEVSVPMDELMKRLTGRRSCPVCGEIYNVYSRPPQVEGRCDMHPDAELDHRVDDNEASVRSRLDTYVENTEPLIKYYRDSGRLKTVDGIGEVEEIFRQLDGLV